LRNTKREDMLAEVAGLIDGEDLDFEKIKAD
jgi:hypothetical protein